MAGEEALAVFIAFLFSCCGLTLFGCCCYAGMRSPAQPVFLPIPTAPPSPTMQSVYDVIPDDEPTPL